MDNANWITAHLGSVATITMGQSPPSSTVNDDGLGMPFIQGNAEFGPRSPRPVKYCSKPQKQAQPGDILLSVRAPVGALNLTDGPLCIGRGLSAITATGVEPAFLWHALRREVPRLVRVSQGSTFAAVNKADLYALDIPLPLPNEQRKIAAILSSVDDAIEKTQAVIDQVQVVKRSLMQELLTRGLPGRHTRFKQTAIGEIPASWCAVPLSDVVFFQEGPGLRKWLFRNHGMPFINIRCISDDGSLDLSSVQYISEQKANESYQHFFLETDDTVVSSSGTLGRMAVVREADLPLMLNTSVIRFRTLDERICATSYMRAFLSSERFLNQILRESQGSAQRNFGPSHLRKVHIPLPPESEQKLLAATIATHGERLAAESAHRVQLLKLKSALMSVLLTGELRVTPDAEAA